MKSSCNTFIIPMDFSSRVEKALAIVINLSKGKATTIVLTHAISFTPFQIFKSKRERIFNSRNAEIRVKMDGLKKKYKQDGISFTQVVEEGSPDEIIRYAFEKYDADLVVFGRKIGGDANDFKLDKTVKRILRASSLPMLISPTEFENYAEWQILLPIFPGLQFSKVQTLLSKWAGDINLKLTLLKVKGKNQLTSSEMIPKTEISIQEIALRTGSGSHFNTREVLDFIVNKETGFDLLMIKRFVPKSKVSFLKPRGFEELIRYSLLPVFVF